MSDYELSVIVSNASKQDLVIDAVIEFMEEIGVQGGGTLTDFYIEGLTEEQAGQLKDKLNSMDEVFSVVMSVVEVEDGQD